MDNAHRIGFGKTHGDISRNGGSFYVYFWVDHKVWSNLLT